MASQVALPALTSAEDEGEPEMVLRLGEVAERLEETSWSSPFLEIGRDGDVLARIGDRVRFHVREGREIVLQTDHPEDGAEIETHLSSLIAGIVLHQREALALHASAVAIEGQAVAFAGASGVGKSTIASALALRGYPLLADDVCRIESMEDGPRVAPGPPRLRLWPDMAKALGRAPEALPSGRANHPKRLLADIAREGQSRPLRVVLRLALDTRSGAAELRPLHGPASVMPIDDLVYRTRLGRRLGRQAGIFRQLTALGGAVRVFRLTRPEGPPDVPRLLDLVFGALREA